MKPLGMEIAFVTPDVEKAHQKAVSAGAKELSPPNEAMGPGRLLCSLPGWDARRALYARGCLTGVSGPCYAKDEGLCEH